MPPPTPVSLSQIAQLARVSSMTVSRALRNHPHIAAHTRKRVLEAAAKLGYTPDPFVAQLMEKVRRSRRGAVRATLALVCDHLPESTSIHNYMPLRPIQERAKGYGYRVETFHLDPGGLSAPRLQQILETRAIDGILLSVNPNGGLSKQLNYERLAVVAFGFGLREMPIDRASTNVSQGLHAIFQILAARGYRRVGMVITPWIDLRADYAYSGALLHYQQSLPATARIPLFQLDESDVSASRPFFVKWFEKHAPDVLIAPVEPVAGWLKERGLSFPRDIGFVVHDLAPGQTKYAGMDHRREEVAAAAVDTLAAHLRHHEYGLKTAPRQTLIPAAFVDGPSLRPAPKV